MLARILSLLIGTGGAIAVVSQFPNGSVVSMLATAACAVVFLGYGLLGAKFDQRFGLGLEKPTHVREIARSAIDDNPVGSLGIAVVDAVKQKRQADPQSGSEDGEQP